jgi:serine/threonine protein kinase
MHGPVLFPLRPWATAVHASAQDLIVKMLDRNVERRITAAEALQHPWFAQVLGAKGQ